MPFPSRARDPTKTRGDSSESVDSLGDKPEDNAKYGIFVPNAGFINFAPTPVRPASEENVHI